MILIKFYVHKSAQKTEKHAFVLPHKLNICIQEGTAYRYIFETWIRFITKAGLPRATNCIENVCPEGGSIGIPKYLAVAGL